jgi:hypothetical protein
MRLVIRNVRGVGREAILRELEKIEKEKLEGSEENFSESWEFLNKGRIIRKQSMKIQRKMKESSEKIKQKFHQLVNEFNFEWLV